MGKPTKRANHRRNGRNGAISLKATELSSREEVKSRKETPSVGARVIKIVSVVMVGIMLGMGGRRVADIYGANAHNDKASFAPAKEIQVKKISHELVVDGVSYIIPQDMLGPVENYPNPLGITNQTKGSFHPVVKFPTVWSQQNGKRVKVQDYRVVEFTEGPGDSGGLAPLQEWETFQKGGNKSPPRRKQVSSENRFNVGRYDENRQGMYTSDIFKSDNAPRTLHIGVDIGGPVGTKVHAFSDGIIHSVGYNPDFGDYGNVIVVEHSLPSTDKKIWALYGHLDSKSIKGKLTGKRVKKGQVLGRIGDFHENGGWLAPHVHFQLAINPPETHDMPGAVSVQDRARALIDYPDPRHVLGPLY